MGRVSRYKKPKKVFNVDELYQIRGRNQDACPSSHPVPLNKQGESLKAEKRRMIVKYGPDGKPIDETMLPSKRKKNSKNKFELEGKRKDETREEFHKRINVETQQKLAKQAKESSEGWKKRKAYNQKRKEKHQLKRQRKGNKKDEMTEKEKAVYSKKNAVKPLFTDRADAPPTFGDQHIFKNKETNPNNRKRFAKFTLGDHTAAPGAEKSGYEKLQMESLRLNVMKKYNEMKQKRKTKT